MGGLGDNLRQIKWDMSTLAKFEKNFYECVLLPPLLDADELTGV